MVQHLYQRGQFLGFSGSEGLNETSKSGGREAEEKVEVRVWTVDKRVAFSMEEISSLRGEMGPPEEEREVLDASSLWDDEE